MRMNDDCESNARDCAQCDADQRKRRVPIAGSFAGLYDALQCCWLPGRAGTLRGRSNDNDFQYRVSPGRGVHGSACHAGVLAWADGASAVLILPPYSSRVDATVVQQSTAGTCTASPSQHHKLCRNRRMRDLRNRRLELPLFSLADIDSGSIRDPSSGIEVSIGSTKSSTRRHERYYNNRDNGGPPSFAGNYGHYSGTGVSPAIRCSRPIPASMARTGGIRESPWILHWVSRIAPGGGCFPRLPILPGEALGASSSSATIPSQTLPTCRAGITSPLPRDPRHRAASWHTGQPGAPARARPGGGQAPEPASSPWSAWPWPGSRWDAAAGPDSRRIRSAWQSGRLHLLLEGRVRRRDARWRADSESVCVPLLLWRIRCARSAVVGLPGLLLTFALSAGAITDAELDAVKREAEYAKAKADIAEQQVRAAKAIAERMSSRRTSPSRRGAGCPAGP